MKEQIDHHFVISYVRFVHLVYNLIKRKSREISFEINIRLLCYALTRLRTHHDQTYVTILCLEIYLTMPICNINSIIKFLFLLLGGAEEKVEPDVARDVG